MYSVSCSFLRMTHKSYDGTYIILETQIYYIPTYSSQDAFLRTYANHYISVSFSNIWFLKNWPKQWHKQNKTWAIVRYGRVGLHFATRWLNGSLKSLFYEKVRRLYQALNSMWDLNRDETAVCIRVKWGLNQLDLYTSIYYV